MEDEKHSFGPLIPIHNARSDECLQTGFEGLLMLCGILNMVICCLKSSDVTDGGMGAAAKAHSNPEIVWGWQATEREVDLDDAQENDQELEEGHGKRFSGEREHDKSVKRWGAWRKNEK